MSAAARIIHAVEALRALQADGYDSVLLQAIALSPMENIEDAPAHYREACALLRLPLPPEMTPAPRAPTFVDFLAVWPMPSGDAYSDAHDAFYRLTPNQRADAVAGARAVQGRIAECEALGLKGHGLTPLRFLTSAFLRAQALKWAEEVR